MTVSEFVRDAGLQSASESRRVLDKYMDEHIHPRIEARELSWKNVQLQKYPRRGIGSVDVLQDSELAIPDLQAWAQLRLQGHLTIRGLGPRPGNRCLLCQAETRLSFEHLATQCAALARVRPSILSLLPWCDDSLAKVREAWLHAECAAEVHGLVSACGVPWRAVQAARRDARVGCGLRRLRNRGRRNGRFRVVR